jgi:gluconolactonase
MKILTILLSGCLSISIFGAIDSHADLANILAGEPERIATGFKFTEGPVWHPDGYLLFSDIPANRIIKWMPDGKPETFRHPSGNSNGLTYDRQGRLIACEHGNRRVSRTEPDGTITVLANQYQGKRLNSPNDAVVKSDGNIYFTDPPYGVDEEARELDFQGVYRIAPDGTLTMLIDDFDRPNGLAFSPDEKTLYIDDSARRHVRAFNVLEDGTLANGRVLVDMAIAEPGVPDGMKVDTKGNLYVTGAGGTWVVSPTGKHLGTIVTPELPANCAFGDSDNKTLYITARTSVYRVRLKTEGVKVF